MGMLQAVKNKVPKTFTTLTRYKLQEIQLLELVQVAQQDIMANTANSKQEASNYYFSLQNINENFQVPWKT